MGVCDRHWERWRHVVYLEIRVHVGARMTPSPKPFETWLSEVKARLEAATPGYSIGRIEERDNWCINVPCPPSDSGLKKWPLCEFYGGVTNPKPDVDLLAHAPTDLALAVQALEIARAALQKHHETWSDNGHCLAECSLTCEALLKLDELIPGKGEL